MLDFLMGLGVIGLLVAILLIPLVVTIIVGVAIANLLGFTGIVWWAFVILFYIVVSSIIGMSTK